MRLLTLLVRYGRDQYGRAEDELETVLSRQLPGVERDLVVIDNALPPAAVERSSRGALIGGDNSVREFSGFDRGLAWAGASLATYDYVHFATSAFHTLYTDYLDRFSPALLRAALGRSACVGHIDCYNEPVRVGPFVSQHWIRTCFFLLPVSQVKALGSMVSVPTGDAFFSGDPSAPFRPEAPLSANYQRYIIDWLTGRDIGQGVTWHSTLSLTPETLTSFEQKALCILNEQVLGARLRALGCALVDVTWLSTHLDRGGAKADIPWLMGWKEQLAGRVGVPALQCDQQCQ